MDWIIRKSALPLFLDLQHHHLRHSRSLYLCTGHHPFDGWNNVVQHPSLLLVGRNFLIILGKCRPTPFTSFGGIQYSRTSISVKQIKKIKLSMDILCSTWRAQYFWKHFFRMIEGKNTDLAVCIEGASSFHVGDNEPELFSHFLFSSQNPFLCILTAPDIKMGMKPKTLAFNILAPTVGTAGKWISCATVETWRQQKVLSAILQFLTLSLQWLWNIPGTVTTTFELCFRQDFLFSSYFWHKRRSRSQIEIQPLPWLFEIKTCLKKSKDSWQKITHRTHHWRRLHYIIGQLFIF